RVVAFAQRSVDLAVGDIGAEAAVSHRDLLPGPGILTQVGQHRGPGLAAASRWFGEELKGLFDGDGEQLILALQAAAVLPALDVRPVAAVEGQDLDAVLVVADDPGQRE